MKRLYLTSSINLVAKRIAEELKPTDGKNKLVFINTASEDKVHEGNWVEENRNSLKDVGFDVFDYTIRDKKEKRIRNDLKDMDVIYIDGGNTFYLLEKAQQSGFINVVRDLVLKDGKVYIGTSAGSVIAGPDIYPALRIDDASYAPNLRGYKGFNLVDFVILPHWGSVKFKELYLNHRLEHSYEGKSELILLRDNEYVEVKDDW